MLISIITPNYNGAKYLAETIRSVVNQTYKNWELIIVDDGSTDGSESVVAHYLSEKIKFIKRPNNKKKGGNVCRNIGIENAKGEYLIFLDSDDLLAPFCLEQRVREIEEDEGVDFVVFNMKDFMYDVHDGALFTRLGTNNPLDHFLGQDCIWQTSAPIWRTSFVKKMGMFNEKYPRLQDPEMVSRALMQDGVQYKLKKDSVPDAFYRKTPISDKRKYDSSYKALCMYIADFFPNNRAGAESRRSLFYLLCFCHFLYSTKEDANFLELCNRIGMTKWNLVSFFCRWICNKQNLCEHLRKSFFKRIFCMMTFKLYRKKWEGLDRLQ